MPTHSPARTAMKATISPLADRSRAAMTALQAPPVPPVPRDVKDALDAATAAVAAARHPSSGVGRNPHAAGVRALLDVAAHALTAAQVLAADGAES